MMSNCYSPVSACLCVGGGGRGFLFSFALHKLKYYVPDADVLRKFPLYYETQCRNMRFRPISEAVTPLACITATHLGKG